MADEYPIQTVTGWIGNSQQVAAKHYLQITDEHFDRAVRGNSLQNKAAQNPAQKAHETAGNESKLDAAYSPEAFDNSTYNAKIPVISRTFKNAEVARVGLEPTLERF